MVAPPLSVLISDDDAGFRETLRGLFEGPRFRTYTAADGAEALRIVSVEPVHLLLTDMHMPQVSGLDLIRALRERHSIVPCILLSARVDEQIRRQAAVLEAFTVLCKPVRLGELVRHVETALREFHHWTGRML